MKERTSLRESTPVGVSGASPTVDVRREWLADEPGELPVALGVVGDRGSIAAPLEDGGTSQVGRRGVRPTSGGDETRACKQRGV